MDKEQPGTRITMKQIAEQVGCSQPTVSVVLNGDASAKRISHETAQLIRETAEKFGYKLPGKHPLPRQKTGYQIGFVTPHVVSASWPQLIAGAHDYLAGHNSHILLLRPDTDLLRACALYKPDALIVATYVPNNAMEDVLRGLAERIPVVTIGPYFDQSEFNSVSTADDRGARIATEHLISLGRRKIAHISGMQSSGPWSVRRRTGYEDALRAAGITVDEQLIVEAPKISVEVHASNQFAENVHAGYRGMGILLSRTRPEAVFAYNDAYAIGVILALEDAGLAVPRDCAVVGFNDADEARFFHIPLTTMRGPQLEYGTLAGHRVMEMIRMRKNGVIPEVVHHQLAPSLVVRRSCGAQQRRNPDRISWRDLFEMPVETSPTLLSPDCLSVPPD